MFSTAVGIIASTADYFKSTYALTAITACVLGIIIVQLNFHSIIVLAFPILLFIYLITIVLILLNVIPDKWASPLIFKTVIAITILFSIPDALNFVSPSDNMKTIISHIPLGNYSLA